jgi:endoglucanase
MGDSSLPQMNITALGNGTFIVDMSNGTHTTLTYNGSLGAPGITQASRRGTTVTTISITATPISDIAQEASVTPSSSPASVPGRAAPSIVAGPAVRTGKVEFGGINIAGFDFHCKTDGTCRLDEVEDVVSNGNAIQQMEHFIGDDGLNTFRLPVSWQFLVDDRLGGPLDEDNFAAYDRLVQGCVDTGAKLCIIDVHNYARWNGRIIGQGGPSNEQFAALWSQMAERYVNVPNIAFDLMNEPHDLDIRTWSRSVQAAVTAIREAGATQQMILLPGTDYMSAKTFVSSGSAEALSAIQNPDGSTENLVYNVHRYLDFDHSGTHAECVTNNIDDSFAPLAQYLRDNGRTAMLTETGGGPHDRGCMRFFCEQLDFIK